MRRRTFVMGAGVAAAAVGVGLHHRAKTPWEAPLPPRGTHAKGGGLVYGIADRKLFDYRLYDFEGYWLRGPDPRPLVPAGYLSFVGASQTFGRFTERPFATQASEALHLPCVNLGWSGAGPGGFANATPLLKLINQSRLLVLQVMAGRSAGNSLMQNTQGNRTVTYQGERMISPKAWARVIDDPAIDAHRFWRLVDETRADWVAQYQRLLGLIQVPVVLLFLGMNPPITQEDRTRKPKDVTALMGSHPQLITRGMVDIIRPQCAAYVEVVTRRGSPQKLAKSVVMDADGRYEAPPTAFSKVNGYYPSPEMHDDVAVALTPTVQALIEDPI